MSVTLTFLFNGLTDNWRYLIMAFRKNRWDKNAISAGKVFEYDGGKFQVASFSNPEFLKLFGEYQSRWPDDKELSDEEADIKNSELNDILSKTILLGWEDVEDEDEDGNIIQITYTPEEGKEVLDNDPQFAMWLFKTGGEMENYKREYTNKKAKK